MDAADGEEVYLEGHALRYAADAEYRAACELELRTQMEEAEGQLPSVTWKQVPTQRKWDIFD